MCTRLQNSVWLLLSQFNPDKPTTIREAISRINDDDLYGISISMRPVSAYILDNLAKNHYLKEVNDGYILSKFGQIEKSRLDKIVEEAHA